MSEEADRALLRRFEPVIRFTRGERFFPMGVEPYVRQCSLWTQRPGEEAVCRVPAGEVSLDSLQQPVSTAPDAVEFLTFAQPLNAPQLAAHRLQLRMEQRASDDVFRSGSGRLSRVGYASRFIDALFSLSLFARGRVTGDRAAAAALAYRTILEEREHYAYNGRVVRDAGWLVVQYWFFYAYNNWRSGFFGANDHESDWEMICVYASESDEGEVAPAWVAYASHDFSGDDLRRRWDDPELDRVGEHPVIYAGAGSHASYFRAGEYLAEMQVPLFGRLSGLLDALGHAWHRTLRQYGEGERHRERRPSAALRVPFVDYARGDGLAIGPGSDRPWAMPELLSPVPGWVAGYRGLWGFYARDPISGENAPAGPMYNRDGTVRTAWHDPVGWAGLQKVTPPDEALAAIRRRQAELEKRIVALRSKVEEKQRELHALGLEVEAMKGRPHLGRQMAERQRRMDDLSKSVDLLRAQRATESDVSESLALHAKRLGAGERGPARAHIRHAHAPASEQQLRLGRLAELWAATSVGLMLVGFVALYYTAREFMLLWLVAALVLFALIESGFRGRLTSLVTAVAFGLATVSVLVLLYEFFWPIVMVNVCVAGAYILWDNLREVLG